MFFFFCVEKFYICLGMKENFLAFLAHGFVRFLLLVAVGEAGRPNVEDDSFLYVK
jgi:hypothetical protein